MDSYSNLEFNFVVYEQVQNLADRGCEIMLCTTLRFVFQLYTRCPLDLCLISYRPILNIAAT